MEPKSDVGGGGSALPDSVRNALTCRVCWEVYTLGRARRPLLLPCGHGYCASCLRRARDAARSGSEEVRSALTEKFTVTPW